MTGVYARRSIALWAVPLPHKTVAGVVRVGELKPTGACGGRALQVCIALWAALFQPPHKSVAEEVVVGELALPPWQGPTT